MTPYEEQSHRTIKQLLEDTEEAITKALHRCFEIQIHYTYLSEDDQRDQALTTLTTELKRARSVVRTRLREYNRSHPLE